MQSAFGKSDWPSALVFANKILALKPEDTEAQGVVKKCNSALSPAQ
jgi:hypothetical protein